MLVLIYEFIMHTITFSPNDFSPFFLSTLLQQPFKSACCIQGSHYSFDQKQSLCQKLGCDYLQCNKDLWNDDAWKSGNEPNEPTAVPTWDTDGHDPTAMPTWDTDGWEDDTWGDDEDSEECIGVSSFHL